MVMPKVRMVRTLTYRKGVFEEGKVYDVEDKPDGFVQHWMVKNGYGELLEDGDEEEAEADPRTVEQDEASKADDENAKQRKAAKTKKAEAVTQPQLQEGQFSKSSDFFSADKPKPAGAQEVVENPPEDMIQGEGGTFAAPAVTAEEDSSEHYKAEDSPALEADDDKGARPKLKEKEAKDHGKRHR
jgi:hypothetical protein